MLEPYRARPPGKPLGAQQMFSNASAFLDLPSPSSLHHHSAIVTGTRGSCNHSPRFECYSDGGDTQPDSASFSTRPVQASSLSSKTKRHASSSSLSAMVRSSGRSSHWQALHNLSRAQQNLVGFSSSPLHEPIPPASTEVKNHQTRLLPFMRRRLARVAPVWASAMGQRWTGQLVPPTGSAPRDSQSTSSAFSSASSGSTGGSSSMNVAGMKSDSTASSMRS